MLEISGDRTYAEMGRFLTPSGQETNDEAEAATDELLTIAVLRLERATEPTPQAA